MKKKNLIIYLMLSIALTTVVPMFFSCYELTQRIEKGTLELGFPFVYYRITGIILGGNNLKYAVHFALGNFLANIAIMYLVIVVIMLIIKLIKKIHDKKKLKAEQNCAESIAESDSESITEDTIE